MNEMISGIMRCALFWLFADDCCGWLAMCVNCVFGQCELCVSATRFARRTGDSHRPKGLRWNATRAHLPQIVRTKRFERHKNSFVTVRAWIDAVTHLTSGACRREGPRHQSHFDLGGRRAVECPAAPRPALSGHNVRDSRIHPRDTHKNPLFKSRTFRNPTSHTSRPPARRKTQNAPPRPRPYSPQAISTIRNGQVNAHRYADKVLSLIKCGILAECVFVQEV
jgi:hypothetical protein